MTAKSVWNNCLLFIKDNIQLQAYKTWFEPIIPVKLEGNILSVQVPSKFFYEWLEEHYINLLKLSLNKELGEDAKLVYIIKMENSFGSTKSFTEKIPSQYKPEIESQSIETSSNYLKSELTNPFVIPGIRNLKIDSQLNPNYNFNNFLEGDSNRLARSAGYAVSNRPGGTSFNPLLIFGGVGLGKTHLANAIGVNIKQKFPEKTVLYISAEKFTQQYIESVKKNNRNDFIHFYQLIDVLIIDDVQFFSGKSGTQDVFFHIFNHLHQNGKQVILTSDKAPVDMQEIEQRLLSRFKWGLSAELQTPDFETRISIIKNKLAVDGVEIDDEIIFYIAKHIKTNIRELEGALTRVTAYANLDQVPITESLAKTILQDLINSNQPLPVTPEVILSKTAEMYGFSIDELIGGSRRRPLVTARQIAMYIFRELTELSYPAIAKEFGGRDHTTVMHAVKKIEELKLSDVNFNEDLELLKRLIDS